MTWNRTTALLALSFALATVLAASAALAGEPPAPAGEQMVSVSVTTPADVAEAEAKATLQAMEGTSGALAPLAAGAETARLAVRTADTLGPSYAVTSIDFSVGQARVGTVGPYAGKPGKRRQLREGPVGDVDPRHQQVRVRAVVRGVGSGEFEWLNDFEYVLQGVCPVALAPGQTSTVDVVIERNAPMLADFGEGLAIACGP